LQATTSSSVFVRGWRALLPAASYLMQTEVHVYAIYITLGDYFPHAFGHFLRRNFEVMVASRGPVQIVSIVRLFFTARGIFESLEFALNRIRRRQENRSYFKNQ
jgi:uncharacterized BrkB/YihY/UPF0761 family membrane protein